MCDSSVLYRVMLQGLSSFLFVFPCFVFSFLCVCAWFVCGVAWVNSCFVCCVCVRLCAGVNACVLCL